MIIRHFLCASKTLGGQFAIFMSIDGKPECKQAKGKPTAKMPYVCVVFGCSNRSNRERSKSFFRVPKAIVHNGEKVKSFSTRRRAKWLTNLSLKSKGAESSNARVCSDHFVKGTCPHTVHCSAANDKAFLR